MDSEEQSDQGPYCLPFQFVQLLEKFCVCRVKDKMSDIFCRYLALEKITLFYLKVGSCRFEGIIILLIHFLNCQKALFTKK